MDGRNEKTRRRQLTAAKLGVWMGMWTVVLALAVGCSDSTATAHPPPEDIPDDTSPPGPPVSVLTPNPQQQPPLVSIQPPIGPGPWPNVPVKDYSQDYQIGPVQSVGVDDAHNLWLLWGERIGVLRPGDNTPVWTVGVGQAASGFGPTLAATASTVICGGSAGRAYVGYATYDLDSPFRDSPQDAEYQRGDMDVVKLESDGTVTLETHLGKTTSNAGYDALGIRNTNDWHYDEDRTVLTCIKVRKGRDQGELYIGTNHGVTRIRGLVYNSHRHPVWEENGGLKIGYNYALGIGQSGQVLIGNEWKLGVVTPPPALEDWDNHAAAPYTLNTWNQDLNSLADMDYWRGFEQTVDGAYYLSSEQYGLWRMTPRPNGINEGTYEKLAGLPTDALTKLAATNDGSLFIGTLGYGLWKLDPQRQLTQVRDVHASNVQQLVYDDSVSPTMLWVLADGRLTVLRGF